MGPLELFSQFFFVGVDILSTTLHPKTKAILAQIGDSTKGVVDTDAVETWSPSGFVSRAAPAVAGKSACQAFGVRLPGRAIILATRDLRSSAIAGALKPGEFCLYCTVGQARIIGKIDGSITRYTKVGNAPGGVDISDTLGPDGWKLTTPWGQISLGPGGFMATVEGAGALVITPDGKINLSGKAVAIQGMVASIGGSVATCIGDKCVPVPGVNNAIAGVSGITGVPAPTVYVSIT